MHEAATVQERARPRGPHREAAQRDACYYIAKRERSRRAAAAAQLEHHVDRAAGLDVVELERLVVRELLARVDQADLVDLDAFLSPGAGA